MKYKHYSNFKFNDKDYEFGKIVKLTAHTEKEYREEYMRLYNVAKARGRAFAQAGMTREPQYKIISTLKPQSKLTLEQLASSFVKLKRTLTSDAGTVSGAEQKNLETIKKWNDWGYKWVNRENLYDFFEFMNKMKKNNYDSQYDSERLIQVFEDTLEDGFDTDELFEEFENFISLKEKYNARNPSDDELDDFRDWQNGEFDFGF